MIDKTRYLHPIERLEAVKKLDEEIAKEKDLSVETSKDDVDLNSMSHTQKVSILKIKRDRVARRNLNDETFDKDKYNFFRVWKVLEEKFSKKEIEKTKKRLEELPKGKTITITLSNYNGADHFLFCRYGIDTTQLWRWSPDEELEAYEELVKETSKII
ncbi:hypothetical protein AO468_00020 [Oenococcus oeni]|uniref:ORF3 protein n=1 Tax=Oenococcus oeni TaxID=1247 RepID=P71457_OENOE|nr:hypothetical protein [Oenococcus oeni]OIM20296.1 hypothetical protein ATX59_09530 [Oenococcus oeni]OIM20299.1 hypothetical protein ATX59_09545 [Oenococcus oeni]PDH95244.1 hypothetical protein AO468_00020 [Oenococcus oeni]CAA60156.1 ORF3 [Oenococcus oeni]CAC67507.1 hypothetical protein [Oenococcus oeni]